MEEFSIPHNTFIAEPVISVSEPKKPPTKRFLVVLLLIFFAFIFSSGSILAYKFIFNNPLKIISGSFTKLLKADSFASEVYINEDKNINNFSATISYHKSKNKFSKFDSSIRQIGGKPDDNLKVSGIFNENEIFIRPEYSKVNDLEAQIDIIFPQITQLNTYKMIKPVLKGEKWLHIKFPEEKKQKDNKKSISQISKAEQKKLQEKFIKSIIVKSHNNSYKVGSKTFHRIVLGFEKKELIAFIEEVKTLNIDLKLSEINNIEKTVLSINNWGDNLIEILVDKKDNNLYMISVSLPQITESVIKDTLEQSSGNEGVSAYFKNLLFENLQGVVKKDDNRKPEHIGKIFFGNFNTVSDINKPLNIIEFDEISLQFQKDFGFSSASAFLKN